MYSAAHRIAQRRIRGLEFFYTDAAGASGVWNDGSTLTIEEIDVAIAGGGPFGLLLAIELGRRGVRVELFDEKPSTAFNPQANATQARTMEHYRRLGFADEVRALGLPPEYPTDIAYFTRFAGHELARFPLPSAREATSRARKLTGSWSAAELPHRVSQKFVERLLREKAEALEGVGVSFGWRVESFEDDGARVLVDARPVSGHGARRVRAHYFAAGDGARSPTRDALGLRLDGEAGAVRDFFGGRMLALYLRAPDFYRVVSHAPAWMNVTFNADRRAFMCPVDGRGEFAFHTQLRDGEDAARIDDQTAVAMFHAAVGAPVDAEIISRGTWTAGYALVAERFRVGRVFLGGDAAHLFTPAGGLGYNTAVEDAVNLGFKLAAAVQGTGGSLLLASYELERRPAAIRNTSYARGFADSLGSIRAKPGLEDDDAAGEALRREAGAYLAAHGRAEFNIPGITFGTRYDGSPVIVADGTDPPPDRANTYTPSATPGGRAPHLWLEDDRSLYDRFGFDWTLLRLGDDPPPVDGFAVAAAGRGVRLDTVDVADERALALYEAPLVLVRPDQVVAWRGVSDDDAAAVLATVTGHHDDTGAGATMTAGGRR